MPRGGQTIQILATFPDLQLSATVTVYTPETNPLVGTWRERAALPCESEKGEIPGEINELIFNADGTFSLTWYPFEVYRDYWGTYTYDALTGRLVMTINGGNYVPQTVDLDGTAAVQDDGSIRLDGMYFGPPSGSDHGPVEPTCGYILDR